MNSASGLYEKSPNGLDIGRYWVGVLSFLITSCSTDGVLLLRQTMILLSSSFFLEDRTGKSSSVETCFWQSSRKWWCGGARVRSALY